MEMEPSALKDLQYELFKKTIDSLDQKVIIHNKDYEIIYANKSVGDPRGAVGKKCYEVSHGARSPCDKLGETCALKEVLRTGKSVKIEHIHQENNGNVTALEIIAHPYKKDGKIEGILEFIRDTTEEKKTRLHEQILEFASNEASEGLLAIDMDYNIMFNNPAVADPGSSLGKKCYEVTHGKKQPCWKMGEECPLKRIQETKRKCIVEHVHDKDGRKEIANIIAYPLMDEQEEVKGILEIISDVTEDRQREKEALTILENADEGIAVIESGRATKANSRFIALSGINAEDEIPDWFTENSKGKKEDKEYRVKINEGKKEVKMRYRKVKYRKVQLLNKEITVIYMK